MWYILIFKLAIRARIMQIKNKGNLAWVFPAAVIFVVLLWIGNWYCLKDDDKRGEFGDMFGGLNTLFTGLAFAGVIATMLLQQRELKLQREELELTREELRGQKEQLEVQNQTLKKQNFEGTFFQLLRVQNEIVNSMKMNTAHEPISGRACFKECYNGLIDKWTRINQVETNESRVLEIINTAYLEFPQRNQIDTDLYFRNLFQVIAFVDRSEIPDKNVYTNFVCAQLSNYELALLFYYCLSNQGNFNLKQFVEEYALLKNISVELLFQQGTHKKLYPPAAYGES